MCFALSACRLYCEMTNNDSKEPKQFPRHVDFNCFSDSLEKDKLIFVVSDRLELQSYKG